MYATLIVGGGPGGTGPLVWAAQNGKLAGWLAEGVAVIDGRSAMGGTLGRYIINSDSLGAVYLECLDAPAARPLLGPLLADPSTQALIPMRHGFPPLALVDRYLHRLGAIIEDAILSSSRSDFHSRTSVRTLHLREDGSVAAVAVAADGRSHIVEARTAIMALGGHQDYAAQLSAELMPEIRLGDATRGKVIPSDLLMTGEGLRRAAEMLDRARTRRVVILGGSHSAFSAAWVLTTRMPEIDFGLGDIVMAMRRQPKIFYETKDHAQADGYAVAEIDICPRTQRVNRLGGLRGDGREMWRRLARRPGTEPEPRVTMRRLHEPDLSRSALRELLDQAALVITAFGYRSRTVPVFAPDGRRLRLSADAGGAAVGAGARLRLTDGTLIPNMFCIGLGTGYAPTRAMGGEPSFNGQANSLWLYQNDIGGVVYRGVQDCLDRARQARQRRARTAEYAGLAAPAIGS